MCSLAMQATSFVVWRQHKQQTEWKQNDGMIESETVLLDGWHELVGTDYFIVVLLE